MAIHDDHIDPRDALTAFLEYGKASAEQAFRYHLHLIGQCPECTRRLLRHVGLSSLQEVAAVPNPGIDLPALAAQVELAPLVAWLESLPHEERLRVAGHDTQLHRPAMVRQVLEQCRQLWVTDPEAALRWNKLAFVLLGQVPERPLRDFFAGSRQDLRALGWAYHGTLMRLRGKLVLAGQSFSCASEDLGQGRLDELVEAEVLLLHGGLLRAQRRFEEAEYAIEEAAELYGCACRWHEQGRALLAKAKLHCAAGNWPRGLRELNRAVPLLESKQDSNPPTLHFTAALLRLRLLWLWGHYEEAQAALPEALARDVGGPTQRLHLLWYEAAILAGLGREEEAEPIFRLALDGFRRRNFLYELALVVLELTRIGLARACRGKV